MGFLGKSGWVVIGLFLVIVGLLIKSSLVEALLDVIGWIMVVAGIVALVVGVVGLVTGKKN
jgi:hypothetical protein